jgi:hypothetical protein
MGELSRHERLQIMLDQDELKAIDDWRFTSRMPSRASAIRELLRRGLASVGFADAEQGAKSKDFGVIENGNGTAEAPTANGGQAR